MIISQLELGPPLIHHQPRQLICVLEKFLQIYFLERLHDFPTLWCKKKNCCLYWKLFKITYFFFLPTITRYQCLHSHVAWTEQIPNVSHSFFVLYFKLDFLFRNLFAIHVGNAFAEIHSLFSLSFHNQPPKRFRRNPDKKTWSYKYDSQRKHRFKATK